MAGALVGGAVGVVGGPLGGAAAGVAVAHALRTVGEEVEERALAPHQHARIGAVWLLAQDEIQRRLERGDTPRTDGFFEGADHASRPAAEELLEGLLLHAGDEYEELKLPFLARLYASLCFRADIASGYAHYLLTLARRLTYRQLGLLALFSDEAYEHRLEELELRRTELGREPLTDVHPGLTAELDELGNQSVLGVAQEGGWAAHMASVIDGGSFAGINRTKIVPTPVGRALFELLGLSEIAESIVGELLREFGE
jgi:hypothetical protein